MHRLPLLVLAVLALAAAPGSAAQQSVTIGDACGPGPYYFCYSPQTLTASSGESVTWTNNSVTPIGHTITRCTLAKCNGVGGGTGPDKWTDSGTIYQGQRYSNTFTGAGTYTYYCTIHGYAQMHGTITVTGGSSSPPPPIPVVSKLKPKKNHRSETIAFTLSVAARVELVVSRGHKTYRTKTVNGHAGSNSTAFRISGLKKGRYTLTATPTGGTAVRASFTV